MARTHIFGICLFGIGGLATLAPESPALRLAARAAPACTSIAEPSRRLELADGRIVSIDVQSVARAGESILAVGRYAYVFPADANSRTPPQMVDSILGVLIGGRGRVTLVPNPAAPRTVRYSRTVAMPNGEFRVLYATSAPEGLRSHTDTATLWLATLRNGAWGVHSRIAAARTATLDRASALLQRNGQLTFVYPFRDDRRHDDDGGAVLLQQRGGVWTFDTLRTESEPQATSAIHDPLNGSAVVAMTLADRKPPLLAHRLFLARFDTAWSPPVAVAGDGIVPVTSPSLVSLGSTLVVAWLNWPGHDPARGWLQWLQLDAMNRVRVRSVIDSGNVTFPFELTTVNQSPLWLYHGEPFGSAMTLIIGEDSTVTRLPGIKAEFWNPSVKAIALSGSRLLLFTQRRAQTTTEPMAASFTTTLEIRCPGSAQR